MPCIIRASVFALALFLILPALSGLSGAPGNALAAPAVPDDALKEALRKVLKENPDLVMDVLRDNSEIVLEIAQQGNILRKRKNMLSQWELDAKQHKVINLEDRAFRGNPKAPVTIVAYSDFTCPYCLQAEQVLVQLLKKDSGAIRVTFKALPKDEPYSIAAAKYSTAAFLLDPVKGWDFFDALFKDVQRFEREGDEFLKEIATQCGFDFKKLKSESGGARVQARLDEDRKEADGFGISGTPYFLVNDLMVRGAIPKDMFEEAIEMALQYKNGK